MSKADLDNFGASDRILLDRARMLPYSNSWVACFNQEIVATDAELDGLFAKLDKKSLYATAIRYIESDGMAAAGWPAP